MSETPADTSATKKSSKLPVLIAVSVVLLGAIGGATYYFTHKGAAAAAPPPETPGMLPLAPFVVNLADAGSQRFLKVTLQLVIAKEDDAASLEKEELKKAQVRSAVLELLTAQHAEELVKPEGKAELKKAISERASESLKPIEVTDVLFTEFVVQF